MTEFNVTDLPARFQTKIIQVESGCWHWTGCLERGYGVGWLNGRKIGAHRAVFLLLVSDIPEGLTVEHDCHTQALQNGQCEGGECEHRRCVNPAHLILLSLGENSRRGLKIGGRHQLAKTHCPHGHPYSGENLYVDPQGRRRCRTCYRAQAKAWRKSE